MTNDPRRRLDDLLDRCADARLLVAEGRDRFDEDVLLRHAAKSILTDLGEAAKHLDGLEDEIDGVPWAQVTGMRDRITHRYFDVDHDVVWDTLTVQLPRVEAAILGYRAAAPERTDRE